MATCQNCGKEWSWKQSVKQSFTLDTGMKCPHCDRKQYLTTKARKRSSIIYFTPSLLLLFLLVFDISSVFTYISLMIGAFLLMVGLYPFFIELSNEEEPLRK
ncbi:hypothetical protein LG329_16465 [Virgibacillus necropolis]|uniref:TIGR04104 family putative zinc finger protein n=1 Tax=Virgibacillus necropolis TaxID=163877 RepID=UPI00384E1B9B